MTNGYLAAHKGQPPVPIYTWAHSINIRILGDKRDGQSLSLWREAIDNAETLLDVGRKLALISKKADLFDKILRDFLGDVQMYAEVDHVHEAVNSAFRDALDDIAVVREKVADREKINGDFESKIYIVAHSEGTVVSWKSLQLAAVEKDPPAWLGEVKGLVTLGSPIDKHHLIWGHQNFPLDVPTVQRDKIDWWNLWDYSDPVGHSLDGIFGDGRAAENNQFRRVLDRGNARYPIPGKAHVDYWKDINLYHVIIQEVMGIPAGYDAKQRKVTNRWWGNWKAMRTGDFLAYGLARGAEVVALLYFLSRLLNPIRQTVVRKWPSVAQWLDKAKTWPLPSSVPISHYLNMALWTLGIAWIWELAWDNKWSSRKQDENLNLEQQLRWERVAMFLWGAVLVYASINIQAPHGELKDYLGWATGLVTVALIWKLHTAVHKGLVQLWRYGKGGTQFSPKPTPADRAQAVGGQHAKRTGCLFPRRPPRSKSRSTGRRRAWLSLHSRRRIRSTFVGS